jgi:hypothetical protein
MQQLSKGMEQERLSVWYEASDEESQLTDDDMATTNDHENDTLLPPHQHHQKQHQYRDQRHHQHHPAVASSSSSSSGGGGRHSILIGGSTRASGLPISSGPRHFVDKSPITCIDVSMLIFSTLIMAVYGVAAYYAMHWRVIWARY